MASRRVAFMRAGDELPTPAEGADNELDLSLSCCLQTWLGTPRPSPQTRQAMAHQDSASPASGIGGIVTRTTSKVFRHPNIRAAALCGGSIPFCGRKLSAFHECA
jgi:hypothetical protein